ncbi:hypothetical protein HUG10_14255 [Halorarum halophilum]|uniref:DUF8106 domain-containing protein n=1 Tax=Halorarum halophilum TaxID=2743090 RepID=A0A7D5KMS6_9EURY|nr:hypothetical protein [Halobaculum halophilum]QLG28635.1 hypothetical protein HUG10_14255 [Halobaculum halophilum]
MTATTQRTDQNDGRRKTVLFCPECGYESPIAENWLETTTDAARVLVCPVCETIVDRRARGPPPAHAEAD